MSLSPGSGLLLRSLAEQDRTAIEDFVMSDPDYVRTCFDREPAKSDVENILRSLPQGVDADSRHLVGTFSANGVLVGLLQCVSGWPTATSYYVGLLQVRPSHRKRGVARALLNHAEDAARTSGHGELRLGVIARNTAALAFWKRQRFDFAEPEKAQKAEPLDTVIMHRTI